MPIPAAHTHRYVYHFTHIDNLPGLLRTGLLAHNHPNFPGKHRSIAAADIQARRAQMQVTCAPGGCVHDYVPLYFGSRSPMLLGVVNAKNIDQFDILYFEFPINLVESHDVVFTNSSANAAVPPNFYSDPVNLDNLDWEAIDSLKWGNADSNFRQRRMAELLVRNQLPLSAAARCIVWNDDAKQRVQQIVGQANFPPIDFEAPQRRHWFTNSVSGGQATSIVSGPKEIALIFNETCNTVAKKTLVNCPTPPFQNLSALLCELKKNFGCLPQTSELIGLESDNGFHKLTVDKHTLEVVGKLLASEEYDALTPQCQELVELSAYLHDIGKGPKSRWANNGGRQKVDPNHPVAAMPMMAEILTAQVANVDQVSVKMLLKLVCYHDLVGDVLGKGRDKHQIVDVVDSKEELDMLFALGKADATSLREEWWDAAKANDLYACCLAAIP